VAKWVYEIAQKRSDAEFELVDIKDFNLPLFDEPMSPMMGQYTHQHTKDWSAKIASFDAYVFVTPEYNHATSAALKNAIDFLYHEWVNKAAGFVGYGGAAGVRAVENLRLIMGEMQVADVKAQVGLSLFSDFENFSVFKPAPQQEQSVNAMLDQVSAWGGALKTLREKQTYGAVESTAFAIEQLAEVDVNEIVIRPTAPGLNPPLRSAAGRVGS
jgi:NAD(P)H-dependent FMN reductase